MTLKSGSRIVLMDQDFSCWFTWVLLAGVVKSAGIRLLLEQRRVVAGARKAGGGILDPPFKIVRHCSLKFSCLVWVREQAERID